MKLLLTFLLSICVASGFAASVMLAWNPSTSKSVKNYSVYYGGKSATYTNKVSGITSTSVTISGLTRGTMYYFATTTTDTNDLESSFSSQVSYAIPASPATNGPPTLNAIAALTLNENAGSQTVNLTGITSGLTNKAQTVTVTASSSNPSVIPTPAVNYISLATNGTLSLASVANAIGTATITVTVNNGGAKYNLTSQSFNVSVGLAGMKIRAMPAKQFMLTVTGPVGHTYSIQATTDFKTWTTIGTVTVGSGGSVTFTDTNAASFSRRFYRTQG